MENEARFAEENKRITDRRPDLKRSPIFQHTTQNLRPDFIRSQANVSLEEAQRRARNQQNHQAFEMPIHFASKTDYVSKLTELLMIEAETERLRTEMVA